MDLSDDEVEQLEPGLATPIQSATPVTPADQLINGERLKRKRGEEEGSNSERLDDLESTPSKRLRSETPPPPPAPPVESNVVTATPVDIQHASSASTLEDGMEPQETGNGATVSDSPLDPPAELYMEYAGYDETHAAEATGEISTIFDDIHGTPSDGDEVEGHGSIDGLGIRHMPELQVRQGR